MELNPRLKAAVLTVVDNQLTAGEPAETQQTLARLMEAGFPEQVAKELIGSVVVAEVFTVMKRGERYDAQRFVAALHRLPSIPDDNI